jgi:hypothetical protein
VPLVSSPMMSVGIGTSYCWDLDNEGSLAGRQVAENDWFHYKFAYSRLKQDQS